MNHPQNNYILCIDESGKSKLSDETGRYFLKIRVEKRIAKIKALKSEVLHKQNQENVTPAKICTVAGDRVSELAKTLKNVRFG